MPELTTSAVEEYPMDASSLALTAQAGLDRHTAAFELLRRQRPLIRDIVLLRQLSGGFSEASVLVCDIQETPPTNGSPPLRGQYVVKISDTDAGQQAQLHQSFVDSLGPFAETRVPPLLLTTSDADIHADVYGIANNSMQSLRAADEIDFQDLADATRLAAEQLLESQLHGAAPPDYTPSIGETLGAWLPSVFRVGQRRDALLTVAERLGAGNAPLMMYQGEYLPNPVHVWSPGRPVYEQKAAVLRGPTHGDLHLRNILVSGAQRSGNLDYWVIDVNWGEPAPLLYDQAYLEVSVFINELRHDGARSPLAVLSRVDKLPLTSPLVTLPRDQGLLELVQGIRRASTEVLERAELRRRDVWELQYPMARVAAGLNWATKPTRQPGDDELRNAAFVYAAWATNALIRQQFPKYMAALNEEHEARRRTLRTGPLTQASVTPPDVAQKLLLPFQEADSGRDLYLVADQHFGIDQVRGLAHLRWTAIFDLDPASDDDGLGSVLNPRLRLNQHIVQAGSTAPDSDRKGVVWLHANGWNSRSEPQPTSFDAWRRSYLPTVRDILAQKAARSANQAAALLVLRSGCHDRMVDRIREAVDEQYAGTIEIVELVAEPSVGEYGAVDVLDAVTPALPTTPVASGVVVPGQNGPAVIPSDDYLWLDEDLEILHAGLLAQAASSQRRHDEFWRGRPPGWVDLAARLDVARKLQPELQSKVENALAGPRPTKIELAHSPGAGGTTLARRIAWDLSSNHPTAVLRQYSSGTLGRLQDLVKLTDRAVLLVAEAAYVSEAELEELQNGLRQRSTRVVTLWVNRTNASQAGAREGSVLLLDPMHGIEPRTFADVYERQAVTQEGRRRIRDLGQPESVSLHPQWLSPFFFGLCAYDQQFTGVTEFVRRHLDQLNPARRQVAKFLALITRYGQLGIPLHLLRYWLTAQWVDTEPGRSTDEEMRELLGDDLRHITVIDAGAARLMHPQVAERVLQQLLGGTEPVNWKINLPETIIDFIHQLTSALGPENTITLKLLENLLVRRIRADEGNRGNFSELILLLSKQSAHRVLEQLTTACPTAPHFWNHLGRHLIYEMRAEYPKAEQYLQRAVDLSKGRDPLHLHTLGQVRRIAIEEQIKSIQRRGDRTLTAEQLRDQIADQFNLAMDAFAKARSLSPDSEHSYITPVQLVLHVVERLRRAAGFENVPDLIVGDSAVAGWVSEQFGRAETLLDEYRNVKSGPMAVDSRHFRKVDLEIEGLYGNVEFLMEQWRSQLEDNDERASIGRALARAHMRRASHNWLRLDVADLREIEACLDNAMRATQPTESDLRTWFQAYRRLPEYDELRALDRFSSIVQHLDSLEAHYYLYVLHFLRWLRKDEHSQDAIRSHLERSASLARARSANSQWSFEWLSIDPEACALTHFSELGEWSGHFWNYVKPLRRITGIIQEIKGPQFGTIKIGEGRLTARFVPGDKFRESRHINAVVDFFLGFSYEGPRAFETELSGQWRPSRAQLSARPFAPPLPTIHRESAPDAIEPKSVPAEPEPQVPARGKVPTSLILAAAVPDSLRAMANSGSLEDVVALIDDLIISEGGELGLMKLGSILSAQLGLQRYEALRKGRGLKKFTEDLGFLVEPSGSHLVIRQRH